MPGSPDDNSQVNASPAASQECARAARLIRDNQGRILDMWLAGAINRIPAAQDKGRVELADHFTELLDDLVIELQESRLHGAPEDIRDLQASAKASALHGRERAVVKGYTVGQLSHEYVVLRRVLTTFCRQHDIVDPEALEIINRIIEIASLASVNAFSKSMQEIQQKLAGTLVHDVRTPLGVAYTYAEIISLADLTPERRTDASRTITRSLRRAISMLEELLDVTKLSAGQGMAMKFERADLNRELGSVCGEARQIYDKRIVSHLCEHPVHGVFDVGLITRTVENLISNAAKFGYEGTPITISLNDCGDYVDLRVHNEGDPIPEQERENIFCFFSTPMSRGENDNEGWGLGLSLIKAVADNHGGKVIFESEEGEGTSFGMTLYKYHHADGDELSVLV